MLAFHNLASDSSGRREDKTDAVLLSKKEESPTTKQSVAKREKRELKQNKSKIISQILVLMRHVELLE